MFEDKMKPIVSSDTRGVFLCTYWSVTALLADMHQWQFLPCMSAGAEMRWMHVCPVAVTPLLLMLCMGWEIAAGVLQPSWSPKLILSTVFVARFYRWVSVSAKTADWGVGGCSC